MVQPGADPAPIRLAFAGAERLELEAAGDLVVHTAAGEVRLQRPVVYQEVDGARQKIASGYSLLPLPLGESWGEGTHLGEAQRSTAAEGEAAPQVSFALGPHDASLPLVIDPVLVYSTFLGGTNSDLGCGIAVDSAGNAYVTGSTTSATFPTTTGAFDTTTNGSSDAFVTKLALSLPGGFDCASPPAGAVVLTGTGAMFSGTGASEVIIGTTGPDTINGGAGDDTICGLGGDDRIEGGNGNDLLIGGEGTEDEGGDDCQGQTGTDTASDCEQTSTVP